MAQCHSECVSVCKHILDVTVESLLQTDMQTNLSEFHVNEFVLVDCYIPHTHHRAGSCSDDGCRVGTGGAQRFPPVTQTLTHSKGLEMDVQT